MTTFLIAQICFVLLGISNSVSTGDCYVTRFLDSTSGAHRFSDTTINGRKGKEIKRAALAKASIGQPLVYVGSSDSSIVYGSSFAPDFFVGQHQKGSIPTLMPACLCFLSVQKSKEGPPYTFPKFDEYGDLPFTKEKQRLDYFAQELESVPGEPGYIIEYRKKPQNQKALARAKRAKDYLVKVKGINGKRIRLVNGGYQKEFKIELRLGPVGSK